MRSSAILLAALATCACGGPAPLDEPRFCSVEIHIDSGPSPLAAWQVEVRDAARVAKLVGVEGGDHPAFAHPAHHDPKAVQDHRVVLLAYHLDGQLPTGQTRVATLHFAQEVEGRPHFEATLIAATDAHGRPVAARVELRP